MPSGTEGVLLVDAINAFNCLNRKAALQNVAQMCPSIAPAIVNTYRDNSQLCIDGEVIYSQEGTTQGDPGNGNVCHCHVALVHHLAEFTAVRQVWFADDATVGGLHYHLKDYWDELEWTGPDIGYYANATKSLLIVKEEHYEQAVKDFGSSGL